MITIQPSNPTSDDQIVFELSGGTFGCSEISKHIIGSHFFYEASNTEGPCLGAPVPFEDSWNVGRLEAGAYQITYIDAAFGEETEAFAVLQGELPFPTPPIPSMGFLSTVVLAMVIAWFANKSFKRRDA